MVAVVAGRGMLALAVGRFRGGTNIFWQNSTWKVPSTKLSLCCIVH